MGGAHMGGGHTRGSPLLPRGGPAAHLEGPDLTWIVTRLIALAQERGTPAAGGRLLRYDRLVLADAVGPDPASLDDALLLMRALGWLTRRRDALVVLADD